MPECDTPRRSRFYWLSPFLLVLSLACDVAVVWTAYLLITHKIGLAVGIPLIVIALVISIWAKSPWRRRKVSFGAAMVVLVITAIIMTTVVTLASVQPLADAGSGVVTWVRGMSEKIDDAFAGRPPAKPQAVPVPTCEWAKDYPSESYRAIDLSGPKTMTLKTIQHIVGAEPKQVRLKVDCVPCVINYGYEPIGADEHKMFVDVWKGDQKDMPIINRGVDWVVIDEKGDYTINIDTVGADWWLKIGVQ
jgi:hypothetical protein